MKRISVLFFVYALIFGSVLGCAQQDPEAVMTVSELKERMKSDTSLVVLDVRTPQELAGHLGKLENVINIPVRELKERIDELDGYKDREIAVICKTGNRSKLGTEILRSSGFKAKNVLGGMTEYRQSEGK